MAPLHLTIASLALGARCAFAQAASVAAVYDSQFSRITEEEWADIFSTANATVEVPFPGYDITAPYPGNRTADDWRLSVRVKDGIPSPSEGMEVTGSWVTWGAPKDLMVKNETNNTSGLAPLHPSWQVVQTYMRAGDLRSDDEEVDPTCKGLLSDECIQDFHQQLADTFNEGGNKTGAGRYPSPTPPSSCRDGGGFRVYQAYTMTFPHDNLNFTKEEDGLFTYAKVSPGIMARHEPGNLTDYDKSIRAVHIMAFVWGYSNLTDWTPETTKPETTIVCARANAVEGSRTLEDGADNPDLDEGSDQGGDDDGNGGGSGNGNGNGAGSGNDDEPSSATRAGTISGLLLVTVGAGFAFML
ncbi:hypothetical protein QBC39DRAFT_143361 [Podospora conica]|nr:hypothetical protein QBC39DRAFT_143361 [Schizothecium conicum]